jgi:hypothetical protein
MKAATLVRTLDPLSSGRVISVLRAKPRAAVVVKFLEHASFHGLDPELIPTDRLLDRWAVSQGSDDVMLKWEDAAPRSRPPPLDDDTAIIVDQVVMHSPVQTRKFVCRWYLRPNEPMSGLALALGLHRDSVLMRWRSSLWAMRREFIARALDV